LLVLFFKLKVGQQGSDVSFVTLLYTHVGDDNSSHNQAIKMNEASKNQRQSISTIFNKNSEQSKKDCRIWLTASLESI
jgi:hypothetical protein